MLLSNIDETLCAQFCDGGKIVITPPRNWSIKSILGCSGRDAAARTSIASDVGVIVFALALLLFGSRRRRILL